MDMSWYLYRHPSRRSMHEQNPKTLHPSDLLTQRPSTQQPHSLSPETHHLTHHQQWSLDRHPQPAQSQGKLHQTPYPSPNWERTTRKTQPLDQQIPWMRMQGPNWTHPLHATLVQKSLSKDQLKC